MNAQRPAKEILKDLEGIQALPDREYVFDLSINGPLAKIFGALVATHPSKSAGTVLAECILNQSNLMFSFHDTVLRFNEIFSADPAEESNTMIQAFNILVDENRRKLQCPM